MFHAMLIKRAVGLCAVIGGLCFYGMKGLLVGAVIDSWFSYLYNALLVSKQIGYSFRRQILDLLPVAIVSALAGLACYGMDCLFDLNLYVEGGLKVLLFLAIYLGWSFLFKPEAFKYIKSIVTPYLKKLFHRA